MGSSDMPEKRKTPAARAGEKRIAKPPAAASPALDARQQLSAFEAAMKRFHEGRLAEAGGLFSIADLDREELLYPAFLPSTNPHLAEVETQGAKEVEAGVHAGEHRQMKLGFGGELAVAVPRHVVAIVGQ